MANIKHIVVFDRYYPKNVVGFSRPFYELVTSSLNDLGYQVEHLSTFDDIKNIRDSLVLCIVPPENFISKYDLIDRSNKIIWWNLEPFDIIGKSGNPKLKKRREIVNDICQNRDKFNVSRVLFFNRDQAIACTDESDFLPIGYHSVLENEAPYNNKKNEIIFAGYKSVSRSIFFNRLNRSLSASGIPSLLHLGHGSNKTFEQNIGVINEFKFGLDCPSEWTERHIHWHRIMMYAANKAMLFSWSDLSAYGMRHMEHYIRYTSETDCFDKIKEAYTMDRGSIHGIAENMLSVVKDKFYMPSLFKKVLIGELDGG